MSILFKFLLITFIAPSVIVLVVKLPKDLRDGRRKRRMTEKIKNPRRFVKYKQWHIGKNVDFRYDLTSWAIPLHILHWSNYQYGCKETQIQVLCFTLRILHRKEDVYDRAD